MTAVLSKFLGSASWSLQYNCYESFHPWTPHCSEACLDIFFPCLQECLKIYAVINFATCLVRRKYTLDDLWSAAKRTLTSASFVAISAANVYALFCLGNKLSGNRISFLINGLLVPNLAGLSGIVIEPPRRRQALALFGLNLASEIMFKRAVERGWLRPIPNGEVLIFAIAMAAFLCTAAKKGHFDSDPIGIACKFIIGSPSAPIDQENVIKKTNCDQGIDENENSQYCGAKKSVTKYVNVLSTLKNVSKALAVGYLVPTLLKLASKPKTIMSSSSLIELLKSQRSLRFSLFLGSLCGLHQTTSHLLRRWTRTCEPNVQLASGFVGGLSAFLFPSSTLSMHMFWRAAESVGNEIAQKYSLSSATCQLISTLTFSLTCGHIFYSLPGEQRFVRKSYMNFLDKVTGGKVYDVNKLLFDMMGVFATKDYEYVPTDLDIKYVSRQYMETVLVWLI